MTSMNQWYPEVDILKATAIILIVFGHMDNYVSCYSLIRLVDGYAALIGLSIFFFISGFLLSQTDSVINSMNAIKKFYIKKFIRIYPLYWIALASLVIIFGLFQINPGHVSPYNFSLTNILIHFFGLQGIFPYDGIFPYNYIQSMWFVGVIVLFYLLYPIIVYLSKNLFEIFVASSLILILLGILHFFLGLIEINALTYFPIFISGIFINRILYSQKIIFNKNLLKRILFFYVIIIFMFFLVLAVYKFNNFTMQFLPQILRLSAENCIKIFAMISLCIIYLIFTHLYIKIHGKIMSLISLIAFATYAIYLFHHQFLAVFSLIIDLIIQNIILQDLIILTFGFAGAILCGILIQKVEQNIFMKYKRVHQR
jgi:peptidoglycan/LPS O-acetylase OafA/YrhL